MPVPSRIKIKNKKEFEQKILKHYKNFLKNWKKLFETP